MRRIFSDKAPKPIGPYSQAVEAKGLLFIAGQIGINPETSELVEGGIEAETRQTLKNLEAILSEAELSFENLVRVEVLLNDLDEMPTFNHIYSEKFDRKNYPVRYAVEVSRLPLGATVEVVAVAELP